MYIAFTKWRGLRKAPEFIGFENFYDLLIKRGGDEHFWNALSHNTIYLVVLPIAYFGLCPIFSFYDYAKGTRGSNFYRVTFFFPQVMSVVAIGILWSFVYHPTIGILSSFLKLLGIENPPVWLGDPNTALWAIVAVTVWQAAGFYMVIFMAGMQSIPTSFYEAAALDGANRANIFFKITFPLLWETTRSALVFIVIGAMNMFGITFTMTQGGPDRATDVLATLLYEEAFLHSRFGYATAIAMLYFVIVMILSFVLMRLTRRQTIEF